MENQQINMNMIVGLLSVALIGGITVAAKETISNIWAAISFMMNPALRKGKLVEVKVQGEVHRGKLKGFSLTRAIIKDEEGALQMILISDLRKTTIRVET